MGKLTGDTALITGASWHYEGIVMYSGTPRRELNLAGYSDEIEKLGG